MDWKKLLFDKIKDFTGIKFILSIIAIFLIAKATDTTIAILIFLSAMVGIFGRTALELAVIFFSGKKNQPSGEDK
ncbi:MAG: hypothetical protein HUU10_04455 [Bacteroidetes bacterium]|nr:hypothetical protein [Bacteroidota bacterium]